MSSPRVFASFLITLIGVAAAVPAPADEGGTPAAKDPVRARPAVLILRVWDPPGQDASSRDIEVVQPRGFRLPDVDASNADPRAGGAPYLGPEYQLAQTYQPNPLQPALRYYFYNVDLSDPALAQNWKNFQSAVRADQRAARREAQSNREWEQRKQHLLAAHQDATNEGVADLRAGEYRQAVITLTRAAELNQGDPVCRIELALARTALGHDREAAQVLRRGLELQPRLVPMQLTLEQYYPSDEEFIAQVDALAARIAKKRAPTADEYFLLGFMQFQRGRYDESYAAFRQAARGLPKDERVQTYLTLTKPAKR